MTDFRFTRPVPGYLHVGYLVLPLTPEAQRALVTIRALLRNAMRFEETSGGVCIPSDANSQIVADALRTGGYEVSFE